MLHRYRVCGDCEPCKVSLQRSPHLLEGCWYMGDLPINKRYGPCGPIATGTSAMMSEQMYLTIFLLHMPDVYPLGGNSGMGHDLIPYLDLSLTWCTEQAITDVTCLHRRTPTYSMIASVSSVHPMYASHQGLVHSMMMMKPKMVMPWLSFMTSPWT